jgi:hypothetical protein
MLLTVHWLHPTTLGKALLTLPLSPAGAAEPIGKTDQVVGDHLQTKHPREFSVLHSLS